MLGEEHDLNFHLNMSDSHHDRRFVTKKSMRRQRRHRKTKELIQRLHVTFRLVDFS